MPTDTLPKRLREASDLTPDLYSLLDEAAGRIEALEAALAVAREAITRQLQGEIERPVDFRYRADRQPSRFDECKHGRMMYEPCETCIDAHLERALARIDEIVGAPV